jgi:hypothetical protein
MRFKSATQPLCRNCAKPIPKYTTTAYFGGIGLRGSRQDAPRSKAEAQSLVNEQVISIKWSRLADDDYAAKKIGHDFIWAVGLWDGETYTDDTFCKQTCAVAFAYKCAENGTATVAYHNAIAKRKEPA